MKKRMPRIAQKADSDEEPGLKVEGEDPATLLEEAASGQTRQPFPIIGIGASAGGGS